jgi:hypothetical protein
MTYNFLIKAKSQPDLSDFCEYIKKPLMILEDIQYRYNNLQSIKKVTTENIEIYHKVESILEKHLPEMINTFCEFSFEYRNNVKIIINDSKSMTAKELLLKNLAKIIEEIQLIEKDFNLNNSFNAIVHNRILSNYGFQPELSLDNGQVKHESIELDNTFNYQQFIENNQFKYPQNPIIAKQNIAPVIKEIAKVEETKKVIQPVIEKVVKIDKKIDLIPTIKQEVKTEKKESFETFYSTHDDPIMRPTNFGALSVITFILAVGGICMAMFSNNTPYKVVQDSNDFIVQITNIQNSIKRNSVNNNYINLSENSLLKSGLIKEKDLRTPWGNTLKIKSYNMKTDNDSYEIEFYIPITINKEKEKIACDYISKIKSQFTLIHMENGTIETNQENIDSNFAKKCSYGNLSLISK